MGGKFGTAVGVYGVTVPARRPAAQSAAGESEDETGAVAAAIRLLESHQLLQQVALLPVDYQSQLLICPLDRGPFVE